MEKQKDINPLLLIPRLNVESSHIKSIGYDAETRTMVVEFKTWAVYSYSPITEECYNEFTAAESKGKYFAEKIKNNSTVTVSRLRAKSEDVDGAPYNEDK